ncbi:M50 family metallopeptidase [Lentisphaera profundi]|uniref:M50 family metallopeptidase n=1 Tax=Lentisphaera profundi TaxID=1658616 RepID=A0ABY7VVV4_9BACT|nr:site-2 protease family protein [Lentisphaera profundi]WDE98358.1 M50 family metallopeptidase [Lentisphaera profundi]
MEFSLFKLPIKVKNSFFFLIGFLSLMWGRVQGQTDLTISLLWFITLFTAILTHELGHALFARWYGMKPRIEIHGMGGVTIWQSMKRLDFRQRFLISFAGPGTGLVLAALFYALLQTPNLPPLLKTLLSMHLNVYVFLNLMNLLPIRPLDGAEVLSTMIGWKNGTVNEQMIDKVSFVTAVGCAVFAYMNGMPILAMMAGYLGWRSYNLANPSARR